MSRSTNPIQTEALFGYVESNQYDFAIAAIRAGADPNAQKDINLKVTIKDQLFCDRTDGESLLAIAVAIGDAKTVKALLRAGADPNKSIEWKIANIHESWTQELWEKRWLTPVRFGGALDLALAAGNGSGSNGGLKIKAKSYAMRFSPRGQSVDIVNPATKDDVRRIYELPSSNDVIEELLRGGAKVNSECIKAAGKLEDGTMKELLMRWKQNRPLTSDEIVCAHLCRHVYTREIAIGMIEESTGWEIERIFEATNRWNVRGVIYRDADAPTRGGILVLRGTDLSAEWGVVHMNILSDIGLASGHRPPGPTNLANEVRGVQDTISSTFQTLHDGLQKSGDQSATPNIGNITSTDINQQMRETRNAFLFLDSVLSTSVKPAAQVTEGTAPPRPLHTEIFLVTGHSLGAAMASLVGGKLHKKVITFENPGVGGGIADHREKCWLEKPGNAVNYLARPSLVNIANPQLGEMRQLDIPHIPSKKSWKHVALAGGYILPGIGWPLVWIELIQYTIHQHSMVNIVEAAKGCYTPIVSWPSREEYSRFTNSLALQAAKGIFRGVGDPLVPSSSNLFDPSKMWEARITHLRENSAYKLEC